MARGSGGLPVRWVRPRIVVLMSNDLTVCDQEASGATRAVVRVQLTTGNELDLCAHHYEANADKLLEGGAELVIDHREALYTKV